MQAAFSYNKWIADINHSAFGFSYKLGDIGTIGISGIMFGVSGIPAYRDIAPAAFKELQVDQATSETYDYQDLALQATFAKQFSDQLSLGVTVKYISETLDDMTKGAFAVDLGSVYSLGSIGGFLNDWKISARLNNMGSGIKYYDVESPIPITFGVGTSFKVLKNKKAGDLLVAIDAVKPQDSPQLFYIGGEYTFANFLSVRGGYKLNYTGAEDNGTTTRKAIKQTIEGLSVGGGVSLEVEGYMLRFDYAMTSMDILDPVHRITLSVGMK
jgi:predicted porin